MEPTPIELRPVAELAGPASEVAAAVERDFADLLAGVEVHHIGGRSYGGG